MCMSILSTCNMYHIYTWCSESPEEGLRSPGTGAQMTVSHHMDPRN